MMNLRSGVRECLLDGKSGVDGPVPLTDRESADFDAATIRQHSDGRLYSVACEACAVPHPKPGEVVAAVEATGLNFRDAI